MIRSGIIRNNVANEDTHAVTLIGYTTFNATDVWIIANSWGVNDWGYGGFGYIERGTNYLAVDNFNVYPILKYQ